MFVQFLIDNWLLVVIALFSGAMLLVPMLKGAGQGGVSPGQAVQLMNREKAILVDVREPAEFSASHVAGSRNVPLAEVDKRLPDLVKNKALPLILVCAKGARATQALGQVQKMGYQQAQVLQGGLAAWKEAGLPTQGA
jgi:rhodanese-related sulfurtransferase